MKKSLLVLSFAAAAMFGSLTAGTPIDQDKLPKEVKSFITKYFPGEKIRKAEKITVTVAWNMTWIFRAELRWNSARTAPGRR